MGFNPLKDGKIARPLGPGPCQFYDIDPKYNCSIRRDETAPNVGHPDFFYLRVAMIVRSSAAVEARQAASSGSGPFWRE